MEFIPRITRLPRPYDPDQGAEACGLVPGQANELAELIDGAAGCSPYLATLIAQEADWLPVALNDPEGAVSDVFADLSLGPPDHLADALRKAKRQVALITGLADLAGVWPLEMVTQVLTDFADLAVNLSIKATIAAEIRRGKLPGMTPDDVETAGGMVALAMGKMGAGELNYSSDIDLICLFDETRFDADDYHDIRACLLRSGHAADVVNAQ